MAGAIELGSFGTQMIQKLIIKIHPFILSEYPEAIYELINLKQTTTVEDYYREFEGFLNCLQPNEEDALSIFIHNLKSDISKSLRLFYPKTLTDALKLAKQLEWVFDELPEKPSLPDQNTTHTIQTINSVPPKQSILTKAVVPVKPPSIESTAFKLVEEIEAAVDETGATAQAAMDTKTTNWSKQETETKVVAMIDQIQAKETTKFGDEKLRTKMDDVNSDQMEQQIVAAQNHRHEVISKTLYVFDTCEKLERTCSILFVAVDKDVLVNDPYMFRLLVMGKRNHCILEQVLVRFLAIDAVVKEILVEASKNQYRLEEEAVHMKNDFGEKLQRVCDALETANLELVEEREKTVYLMKIKSSYHLEKKWTLRQKELDRYKKIFESSRCQLQVEEQISQIDSDSERKLTDVCNALKKANFEVVEKIREGHEIGFELWICKSITDRLKIDLELTRNLEAQLSETVNDIGALQKQMENAKDSDMESVRIVTSELDGAKESLQKVMEQEKSLRSLVESFKVELENVKKEHSELKEKDAETESIVGNLHVKLQKSKLEFEAFFAKESKTRGGCEEMISTLQQLSVEEENARREAVEMKKKVEKLKLEVETSITALEKAIQQLRVAMKEAETRMFGVLENQILKLSSLRTRRF